MRVAPLTDDHTFLFADLAGFTALTEAHGDEHAADLAESFAECVRGLLAKASADEVKTIGDAIMIRADEARTAVPLAIKIVEEVQRRGDFPGVRVGMHTGPAVEREGDWFGATVNIAARVAGAAGGGEVLLTRTTRERAGAPAGVEFERHGETRLRNVSEPVVLYGAIRQGSKRGKLSIDPVCRMVVADGHGAGRLRFRDAEYVFCSLECAHAFAADPERYRGTDQSAVARPDPTHRRSTPL